jgi:hypothetical protein
MSAHDSDRTEPVTTRIRPQDVARLDHMARRRGRRREDLIADAIDAMLAQEMWSGGFIEPPPPMMLPRRRRWLGRRR